MHPLIKYLLSFRLLYIVGGGFFFYLLSVFIDPVFIPALQMPENWCQNRCGCHCRFLWPYFGIYFSDHLPTAASATHRMDAAGVFRDSTS